MKLKGFTLSEVLITIGIIGVVAAMTLPSLVNNAKNKELEAAFKKQYSLLTQALNFMILNDICTTTECMMESNYQIVDKFSRFYKSVKICELGTDDENCFPRAQTDYKYKNYTKTAYLNSSAFDDGQFYTIDGALIAFERRSSDQNIIISIDVNGRNKGPNLLGHDLFAFAVQNKGSVGVIVPMGADNTLYEQEDFCSLENTTSAYNGMGCTVKALYEKDFFKDLP